MNNYSLDSYLQAYGIPAKLDHNYYLDQKTLSTSHTDITDIVRYCGWDAQCLLPL